MIEYRLKITRRARKDIIDIGDYIAYILQEPDISKSLIRGLRHSISQLKFFPYKFSLVQNPMLKGKCIRCMPYKNYYVFYEVAEEEKCIIVLRVGYNRRNWLDILN